MRKQRHSIHLTQLVVTGLVLVGVIIVIGARSENLHVRVPHFAQFSMMRDQRLADISDIFIFDQSIGAILEHLFILKQIELVERNRPMERTSKGAAGNLQATFRFVSRNIVDWMLRAFVVRIPKEIPDSVYAMVDSMYEKIAGPEMAEVLVRMPPAGGTQ